MRRAVLDDASVLEPHDAVGGEGLRHVVGDRDGGAPPRQLGERRAHLRARLRVQSRRGFVEDHDGAVPEHRAGDGEALALPARERVAARTENGVVPLGQRRDEVVGVGAARGLLDLGIRGIQSTEADVLAHGRGEEHRLLQEERYRCPHAREGRAGDVDPVQPHPSGARVRRSHEEPRESGLPRPGGPEKAHVLTGGDVERQILEDRATAAVVDRDALERDVAAQPREVCGVRVVGDLDGFVQQIGDALAGGGGAGDAPGVLREVLERSHGQLQVRHEHDEIARGHRAREHLPSPAQEHRRGGEAHEEVGTAFQSRGETPRPHSLGQCAVVPGREGSAQAVFEAVGLHDANGAERLGRGVGESSLALAGGPGCRGDARGTAPRHHRVQERGDHHDGREEQIHERHHHDEDHEREDVPHQREPRGHRNFLQAPDVAHESLHHVARRRGGVVPGRERLHVGEHPGSQLGGDA